MGGIDPPAGLFKRKQYSQEMLATTTKGSRVGPVRVEFMADCPATRLGQKTLLMQDGNPRRHA